MCVVSMVMDHYRENWPNRLLEPQRYPGQLFNVPTIPQQPPITDAEILEFRKLLERAREYDKKNNEPDCEMESKKKETMELAEKLGIADKLNFI